MPSPEERLNQIEPVISEILVKQDQLAAQLNQLSSQVRQQNANVLNRLTDQEQRITEVKTGLDELTVSVGHGFAMLNQRLTDLFTLLGERIK